MTEAHTPQRKHTRWFAIDAEFNGHDNTLIARVYRAVCARPMSCDEFEAATGVSHNSASPSFNLLSRCGLITPQGTTRTRSGRMAVIWGRPVISPGRLFASSKTSPGPLAALVEALDAIVASNGDLTQGDLHQLRSVYQSARRVLVKHRSS